MHNVIIPKIEIPGVIKKRIKTGMSMSGKVQAMVIDGETKKILKVYPEQSNLILNFGMDLIATTNICDCFLNAVAGTGTTPTVDDSGASQISQSATTVTITGGAFTFTDTATDAGKMIKWDTGEEARIVTVTSGTVATVANSATVASAEFKVYRTNQTGLAAESKRTSTYLTGSANCGTVWTGNSAAHKRTYDFSTEVGSVTYTEIGFANSASPGNNLFSRILLGSGVALVASQALRLVYTLTTVVEPDTAETIASSPITGWASATGVQQIQNQVITEVTSTGTTDILSGATPIEPRLAYSTLLATTSTAHNTFRTVGPSLSGIADTPLKANSLASYTALSFFREKSVTFNTGEANVSNIRSISLSNVASASCGLRYIIDSDQTKDNAHTLTITWRITWTRVLA